jgi:ABC-2 type transport system permease protein
VKPVPVSRIVAAHASAGLVTLVRAPRQAVAMLVVPALLFLLVAPPNAHFAASANLLTASWMCFAVVGVAFVQAGVRMAERRASPWEDTLATLPAGRAARLCAEALVALAAAGLAASLVLAVAMASVPLSLDGRAAWRLASALVLGGLPFAAMGLALGAWTSPTAAPAIANLVHLPLAYGGGLWVPPALLPDAVARVSPWMPTRAYGELAWAAVAGGDWRAGDGWALAAWTLGFALVAAVGWQRARSRA